MCWHRGGHQATPGTAPPAPASQSLLLPFPLAQPVLAREELLVFKFFTLGVIHEALLDLGTELGVSPPPVLAVLLSLFPELAARPRNVGRYPKGMPWL